MTSGRKPKSYPAELVARVASLYAAGHTQQETANSTGVSQKVIWNLMRRHNLVARVAAKRNQIGSRNNSWKGDAAGKYALHRRLYALNGKPSVCTVCNAKGAKAYDYANLSGQYENINDYAAMCRSCHAKYDGKIRNITDNRRDADAQA